MVVDEFRGLVDISALLRWCDRYPVVVEIKGSSRAFCAQKIWFTSNLHPRDWYPTLDQATKDALLRRLTIVHFPNTPFTNNTVEQHATQQAITAQSIWQEYIGINNL